MFSGIVSEIGKVKKLNPMPGGAVELTIACSFADELHVDQSISLNGACHTVVACDEETFTVQSVEETLRKTSIGELEEGSPVNLERSMTLQTGLEGHMVQGHVDTTGTITNIEKEETDWLFTIEYPEEYTNMIVGRGSVSMEGISLTVAREKNNQFTVAIIPYTFNNTNLQHKKVGDKVNLEFDIIGKYVIKYLSGMSQDFIG